MFGVMEGPSSLHPNRKGGSTRSVVPPLPTSRYRPAHHPQHKKLRKPRQSQKTQHYKGELEVAAARAGPRATGRRHHQAPCRQRQCHRSIIMPHGARLAMHSPRTSVPSSASGVGEAGVSSTSAGLVCLGTKYHARAHTHTRETHRRHRHADTDT